MPANRRIRVVLAVDVDPEAWREVYGLEAPDLADDVRSYVAQTMRDSGAADEKAITWVGVMP